MTTPLEQAWEHYGGRLITNRPGKNKACCPLHEDKSPSATIDVSEQKWSCHAGCGYGDIFELIKLAEPGEPGFLECVEIAARLFSVTETTLGKPKTKKRPGRRKPLWVGE